MANVGFGHKGCSQEAGSGQTGQPLGVGDIRFVPRHRFDVACVDDPCNDANGLQGRKWAFPVNNGALHDDNFRAN